VRADRGEIALDTDVDVVRLVRLQIVELDGAELLDHDRIRSGRRGFEIESIAVKSFGDLLGLGVVSEETDRTAAIRKKVDRVANPHGMMIVGVVAGNLDDAQVLEISDPDGSCLAATIALPGILPFWMRNVGNMHSIGRERRIFGDRKRQRSRQAAFNRNRENLILKMNEVAAPGSEEDLFAIRRPAANKLIGGMICQPARHASRRWDDIDIAVAVILAGERNR